MKVKSFAPNSRGRQIPCHRLCIEHQCWMLSSRQILPQQRSFEVASRSHLNSRLRHFGRSLGGFAGARRNVRCRERYATQGQGRNRIGPWYRYGLFSSCNCSSGRCFSGYCSITHRVRHHEVRRSALSRLAWYSGDQIIFAKFWIEQSCSEGQRGLGLACFPTRLHDEHLESEGHRFLPRPSAAICESRAWPCRSSGVFARLHS